MRPDWISNPGVRCPTDSAMRPGGFKVGKFLYDDSDFVKLYDDSDFVKPTNLYKFNGYNIYESFL